MSTSENPLRNLGHIEPLTGKGTWRKWKSDIKLLLEYHGSWGYVNGDIAIPTDDDKLKEVGPLLRTAAYCISITCNETNRDAIDEMKDAKSKFDALKKLYEGDTPAQRMALRRQLYHIEHDSTRPVMDFINSVRNIVNELKAINHAPKPDEIRDIILMNLDPSFEIIQTMLAAQDKNAGENWTIDSLGERLTAFENNRLVSSGSTSIESAHAVRSRGRFGHHPGRGIHRSPPMDNWGNIKGLDGVCNRCGRDGHIARNCFRDMPEHVKERIRHTASEFAGTASTPFLDNLTIAGLHSILESGQTIVLYPEAGFAYSGDNIIKKIHYNSRGEFYAENVNAKGFISYGTSGFIAPAT